MLIVITSNESFAAIPFTDQTLCFEVVKHITGWHDSAQCQPEIRREIIHDLNLKNKILNRGNKIIPHPSSK